MSITDEELASISSKGFADEVTKLLWKEAKRAQGVQRGCCCKEIQARLQLAEDACASAWDLVSKTFVGDIDSAHDLVKKLAAWRAGRGE